MSIKSSATDSDRAKLETNPVSTSFFVPSIAVSSTARGVYGEIGLAECSISPAASRRQRLERNHGSGNVSILHQLLGLVAKGGNLFSTLEFLDLSSCGTQPHAMDLAAGKLADAVQESSRAEAFLCSFLRGLAGTFPLFPLSLF